ncbi:MAG: TIR domain-containing protein [Oscillospiraceae bacterium]|nr:TIR domain-containing protein [Oscillospiraceae bacterium]
MAVIKCKMCGGDLTLIDGQSVAQCEYCGSRQTVPAADNEKKLNLFARANRLRTACEFDKAAGIYEAIVADFPEEAEAYWGLVLCRYGIEYVDDPGTGKKIPTCHRSSFDSVMTDPDFEQAQENADAIARKVYREEAKQIEELRKGIVEVSGKEEPYDIFICYKETAEDGQRTLDSVLAQDIYDALTDKGYRVFFSRITLEDKLGMEYEPYIFAALNSAKIMLAVGTDFEYYNAVWVKNEWSRYLKLMAADKTKHLIPCYKGLDAYDMPPEFAKLQAQDLGKLGAMQDLLRGIEKLLPKASPVSVVQERVVVGGSGDNKIASLLDRGNMALEDGDWAKADSFFEDVLNNDSKNAQAYLGKALAAEKCRTIDAFIRKRKESYGAVKEEKCSLDADKARIRKAEEAYTIPQYLSRNEIIEIYAFDLRYSSTVQGRKRQYQQEQTYWKEHKLLARAEQFATGAVAQNIQAAKKQLFDALADRVKKAEAEEGEQKKRLLRNYEAHLTQADARTKSFYEANLNCRESDYQKWVHTAKASADMAELKKLADFFKTLGDYKDSPAMVKFCNDRVAELQKQQDEAAWLEAKQAHAAEQKRKAIKAAIVALCIIAIAAVLVVTKVIIPNNKYNDAMALLESGEYQKAIDMFTELGDYKDAQTMVWEAKYQLGLWYLQNEDYKKSDAIFAELGYYKDSRSMIHRHEYTEEIVLAPGCETSGTMEYTCIYCFSSYTQFIEPTGHTLSEKVISQPGCERPGKLELICDCGYTEQETIPAVGHSYDSGKVEIAASCEKKGTTRYTCAVCSVSYTETVRALGHSYENATCDKPRTCTNCGKTTGSALGHTTDSAKCTRCGVRLFKTLIYTGTGSEIIDNIEIPKGDFKVTCYHRGGTSEVSYVGIKFYHRLNEYSPSSYDLILNTSVPGNQENLYTYYEAVSNARIVVDTFGGDTTWEIIIQTYS